MIMVSMPLKVTISGSRKYFYDTGTFYSIENGVISELNPNDLSSIVDYRLTE